MQSQTAADLFTTAEAPSAQPLSGALRPTSLAEFAGQQHLVGSGNVLHNCVKTGKLHSMILWGPPGTGKTTLARILAKSIDASFVELSAVTSGVKDIRAVIEQAKFNQTQSRQTVLFVDEVHRFNKSQQDAFLPHIEDGTIILIGATTENPSFEVNNALLSRARVHILKSLAPDDLKAILQRALTDNIHGLGTSNIILAKDLQNQLITAAHGDARRLLNWLEQLVQLADVKASKKPIQQSHIKQVLGNSIPQYDKHGDQFYDLISAFHKSVRGSNPDAALYWMSRIIDAGGDPLYVARRLLAIASEDIGNADPRALQVTLNAWDIFKRVGPAEGKRAIAQAAVYCAVAPKSNATYLAFKKAMQVAQSTGHVGVPAHLRNAPTKLMQEIGYGKDYQYPHDFEGAYVEQAYLPDELAEAKFYEPTDRGLEKQIQAKLARLK